MKILNYIYTLFYGITKVRVQGSIIKRIFTIFVSSTILVLSTWLMFRFTTIYTSKHILYLSHPLSVDTAENHYMKVDLSIKSTEGYTLKSREKDPYLYNTQIKIMQMHEGKGKCNNSFRENDIKRLNYFLHDSLITYKDTLYSSLIPISDIGNLLVFGHYYYCDFTRTHKEEPSHQIKKIEEKNMPTLFAYIFDNDPYIVKLPLGAQLNNKFANHLYFPGNFNVDWYYLITDNSEEIASFNRSSSSKKHNRWYEGLFKLHDISKSYFEYYIFTQAIDELNISFEANEMVEFSNAFANTDISEKSICFHITGDHYSDRKGLSGSQEISFYTKNLESENAQLVRMYFMMTICSFSLGFLLKSIYDCIWVYIKSLKRINK